MASRRQTGGELKVSNIMEHTERGADGRAVERAALSVRH